MNKYDKKSLSVFQYCLLLLFISILFIGAIFNIYINYLAKGKTWDIYPYAEIIWVVLSVLITLKAKSFKLLVLSVLIFLFLDSWVDLMAMGHQAWWIGPPILIEWKWDSVNTDYLLHQYWFYKWTLQVPVRCLALTLCVLNPFQDDKRNLKQKFFAIIFIFAGLNIIWASASHDMLFYFVWYGLYDPNYPYFHYMPPEGTWNLYNMLFIRIPIMYAISISLIYLGKKIYNTNYSKIDIKNNLANNNLS
ncbi:MAG: hypothetical protein ACTSQJ_02120 [Promethearchaeota archaeon]